VTFSHALTQVINPILTHNLRAIKPPSALSSPSPTITL